MAKMTEGTTVELIDEDEDEAELDGWGPVRVRRSNIPAQPSAPLSAASGGDHTDTLHAPDSQHHKRLVT